jgi:CRP-like cAMP-binding protein
MGYIKEYIERITRLNDQDWQFISSCFIRRELQKNTILLKIGETEKYLSFIEKGIVRTYIPGEERELTFGFNFDKEFTCAYDSFLSQFPSKYEQETLTGTIIWRISYSNLQKVYAQTQTGNYWGRLTAEKLFLQKSQREIFLLTTTARERYIDLLNHHSYIIRQVPLKYIASYIGITPQALSRIRKEIC